MLIVEHLVFVFLIAILGNPIVVDIFLEFFSSLEFILENRFLDVVAESEMILSSDCGIKQISVFSSLFPSLGDTSDFLALLSLNMF